MTFAAVFVLGRRGRLVPFDTLLLAGPAILAFKSKRDLWSSYWPTWRSDDGPPGGSAATHSR
jgi:hypothetical protein